jgi:AbrB family looped-hinge helix DNA binding protein
VEFTKASSKGQVMIPARIRKQLDIHEGTVLAVAAERDMIVLKKVESGVEEPDFGKPLRYGLKGVDDLFSANSNQDDARAIVLEVEISLLLASLSPSTLNQPVTNDNG